MTTQTISTINNALTAVIAAAVDAFVVYDGTPNIPPAGLPLVGTDWQQTTPTPQEQGTHGRRVAGKLVKQQVLRNHAMRCVVLLSTTGNKPLEDQAQRAAAQSILDAIDADATLRGVTNTDQCQWCSIVSIKPHEEAWDTVTYSGLEILAQVID